MSFICLRFSFVRLMWCICSFPKGVRIAMGIFPARPDGFLDQFDRLDGIRSHLVDIVEPVTIQQVRMGAPGEDRFSVGIIIGK